MNRPPRPIESPVPITHVWPDLPSDLQQRAVRLLAQIAYAQFRQHTAQPTQEINHDHFRQHAQDSSRPS